MIPLEFSLFFASYFRYYILPQLLPVAPHLPDSDITLL